jgi:caffeoyl-CoA O-methyltransferase
MAKRRGKPPRIPQLGNHGLDDALHEYATSWSSPEPQGLEALRRATWTQTVKPQMLCDELQGRLVAMMSHMIRPQRVLELGTFTGYATACWAEGLSEDGAVDTVDVNDELHGIQSTHWEQLGITHRIRRHVGKALEVLQSGVLFQEDSRPLDVIFVDADKEHQRTYVDWAVGHMRDGGWIVVDNVLWWGEVLRVVDGTSQDPYATRIHELNEYMKGHPELDNVVLPLRDGLHVARRKPRG